MLTMLKDKLSALKLYCQNYLTDFMREPAMLTAEAMAKQIRPQFSAAVNETVDGLKPKVEQTVKVAVNTAFDQTAARIKNIFSETPTSASFGTAASTASPTTTESSTTEAAAGSSASQSSNAESSAPRSPAAAISHSLIGNFIQTVLNVISTICYKFIMNLFAPMFGYLSLITQPTAPVSPSASAASAEQPTAAAATSAPQAASAGPTGITITPEVVTAVASVVAYMLPRLNRAAESTVNTGETVTASARPSA